MRAGDSDRRFAAGAGPGRRNASERRPATCRVQAVTMGEAGASSTRGLAASLRSRLLHASTWTVTAAGRRRASRRAGKTRRKWSKDSKKMQARLPISRYYMAIHNLHRVEPSEDPTEVILF